MSSTTENSPHPVNWSNLKEVETIFVGSRLDHALERLGEAELPSITPLVATLMVGASLSPVAANAKPPAPNHRIAKLAAGSEIVRLNVPAGTTLDGLGVELAAKTHISVLAADRQLWRDNHGQDPLMHSRQIYGPSSLVSGSTGDYDVVTFTPGDTIWHEAEVEVDHHGGNVDVETIAIEQANHITSEAQARVMPVGDRIIVPEIRAQFEPQQAQPQKLPGRPVSIRPRAHPKSISTGGTTAPAGLSKVQNVPTNSSPGQTPKTIINIVPPAVPRVTHHSKIESGKHNAVAIQPKPHTKKPDPAAQPPKAHASHVRHIPKISIKPDHIAKSHNTLPHMPHKFSKNFMRRLLRECISGHLIGRDLEDKIVNYFMICNDLTPDQAFGVVGNLTQENSHYNPREIQGGRQSTNPEQARGGGYGIAQWTPGAKVASVSKQYGTHGPVYSLRTQLKDVSEQLKDVSPTGYHDLARTLRRYHDTNSTTLIFEADFEEGAIAYRGGGQLAARQAYARQAEHKYSRAADTLYDRLHARQPKATAKRK